MALTPEQIAAEINDIGKDLPLSLAVAIQAAADIAIEVIKGRMNFVQNTPIVGVRDSIQAMMDESTMTLGISMPEHGYFQNFGVTGKERAGNTLDEVTAAAFGGKTSFEFGTENNHPGLFPKEFLDLDNFLDQVTIYVNRNLEL